MKPWLLFLIIGMMVSHLEGQISLSGRVVDAITGDPLPFCNISLSASRRGSISDERGYFHFAGLAASDTLIFSYVGYLQATLPAAREPSSYTIALQPSRYKLAEITILSDNSLLALFSDCRERLIRNYSRRHAKAYYKIATQSDNKPVELLEAYYNAQLTGEKIDYTDYKAGRAVLDTAEGNYWNSSDLSRLMASVDLCEASPNLPLNPFCLRKTALNAAYRLKLMYEDEQSYQIEFAPKSQETDYFAGTVWISKPDLQLLKIQLHCKNTSRHPLIPLMGCDSINFVNLSLTNTYNIEQGKSRLLTSFFDYNLVYTSNRDTTCPLYKKYHILPPYKKTKRSISSGILTYLFDYQELFTPPYFNYPPDSVSDYLLMTVLPYNQRFWNDNPSILSDDQKILMFGESEATDVLYRGHLQNGINRIRPELPALSKINATQFSLWSRDKRLILRQSEPNPALAATEFGTSSATRQFELSAQIILDVNQIGDSIFTQSCTVLNSWKSYILFENDETTDAFINMYLDICEIERQKMQLDLDSHRYTLQQIDSLYKETNKKMNQFTAKYIAEVDRGRHYAAFARWNDYILANLGINNLELFLNQPKY